MTFSIAPTVLCRASALLWTTQRSARYLLRSSATVLYIIFTSTILTNFLSVPSSPTAIAALWAVVRITVSIASVAFAERRVLIGSVNAICCTLTYEATMHINRQRLLEIAVGSLRKMASHEADGKRIWCEVLDMDFVEWLTEQIALLDPKKNCVICGEPSDWDGLDPAKSMLHLENGLGLPIGNLTSQLFSNVYLNVFDQFMKRELKCRYYGRYVDDAAVVSADRDWLLSIIPDVDGFLRSELGLELHKGKLEVSEVHRGVEFLGAYIKPWRTYISNHSLRRMEKKISAFVYSRPWLVARSVNSYLGIMKHRSSYRLRRRLFMTRPILRICTFDERVLKVV